MLPNLKFSRDAVIWYSPEEALEKGLLKLEKGYITNGTEVMYVSPPQTLWQHLVAWWKGR